METLKSVCASWPVAMALSFLLSLLATAWVHPLIVRMARERHMVDEPGERKLQKIPVPVLGGMAVFFGMMMAAGAVSAVRETYALFPVMIALTMMMYIGMLDDMIGLSPVLRLGLEVLMVAFLIAVDGVSIDHLHGLFGVDWIPRYVAWPLTAFACCGIINAVNLIDGVDGLSSGFCFWACAVFGATAYVAGDIDMAVLAALGAGALVPFWLHNVFGKTSKMFIGDSGTLMMGMLMSVFTMRLIDDSSPVALRFPGVGVAALALSVLSVPVFDTLRVMSGRIAKGVSPFRADKSHLHHLFIEIGFSHIGTAVSVISLDALNVALWYAACRLGAGVTAQLAVVTAMGLLTTFGLHYVVRRLPHTSPVYRALRRAAVASHRERGRFFAVMRRLVDKA